MALSMFLNEAAIGILGGIVLCCAAHARCGWQINVSPKMSMFKFLRNCEYVILHGRGGFAGQDLKAVGGYPG